jgi:hypothetical protein
MGAPSGMHRDPERVALVIPVVIMGMVGGLERVRGAKREGARMRECIATKRCASCGCFELRRRVACYAFSWPRCSGATPSFAPRPRLQTLGYHR